MLMIDGALLDLLLVNRKGLVSEEVIGVYLKCSDREVVKYKIFCGRNATTTKTSALDIGVFL